MMTKRDVSISMGRVNLLAIPVALAPLPLVVIPYVLFWGMPNLLTGMKTLMQPWVIIPAFLGGVVLHELIHGIGWVIFGGKPFRAVKFGFKLSSLTPYAHCKEPLTASAYRRGTGAPAVILGVLPVMAGFIAANAALMMFGTLFLIAAGGDFLVLWVIRAVPGEWLVEDHPERAGCYVYEPVP